MRYRRRNRYRRNTNSYNSQPSGILLAEFRLYNKAKNVIEDKVLTDIQDKLINSDSEKIYWTTDLFSKHCIGFTFYKSFPYKREDTEKQIPEIYIKIIELEDIKLNTKVFNSCKYIVQNKLFIGYKLTTEQKDFLDELDLGYDTIKCSPKLLKDWDDTVNELIKNKMLDHYSYTDYEDTFKNVMNILFDTDFKAPLYEKVAKGFATADNLYHIINVIEKRIDNKNYRVAIRAKHGHSNPNFDFIVISEDDKDYNLIDKDRICFMDNKKYFYIDINLNEHAPNGKLIINHDLINLMSNDVDEILNKDDNLITPVIYSFYKDKALKYKFGTEDNSKQSFIDKRYIELLEEERQIKIGDIIMTQNLIALKNEEFTLEFKSDFLDVCKNFTNIKKALNIANARFNINTVFEGLIAMSTLKYVRQEYVRETGYQRWTGTTFKINGMDISVKKESNRIKINGIFCRIDDVWHVLSKLICYRDVDEFNKYLKEVSFIGVEWKKMISNGIAIELHNPFYKIFLQTGWITLEKMFMRFSLLWDAERRRDVHLMLNGQRYLIKYKGKFKKFFNVPRRVISVAQLKKELHECIENLDDNMVISIIENAIEEAKIIQKKGAELIANTVKDINAKEGEEEIDGKQIRGYVVIGRKTGNKYFIKAVDLDVYRWENGSWNRRCVVTDHTKERIFEDKLANRLVNIHNEPKKIYTLFN